MTKVCIMAGGTGGHIFPALALAQALQAEGVDVHWLGSQTGMETRILPQHPQIQLHTLNIQGLRGSGILRLIKAPWKLTQAVMQARRLLKKIRPTCVLGFGGFTSGPGGLAARTLGIPLCLHEQNALAGLTNRCLAPFAQHLWCAFDQAFPNQSNKSVVGNPVRFEITRLAPPKQRYAQRRTQETAYNVLIVGGSLGAQVFNTQIPLMAAHLKTPINLYHQAGKGASQNVLAAYQAQDLPQVKDLQVSDFIEDMAAAYAWADWVICRAGALTLAELSAAGVASILVPYPYAVDDHQTHNARVLSEAGGAYLLPQTELVPEKIAAWLDAHLPLGENYAQDAYQTMPTQATEQILTYLKTHRLI
ncbi:UDP-N-acetylglucosamine--N-acetylmuramyl-(pentapeptide) pyrophosphoryl-undecaprenol N-acetylglucosamine transferase [Allopseudospirillum japonicum]|uniref:UDP-N-acetylglucosamine--N-acetylmuramyl-(pentapeptide) pyrophosphoryl-undecaprenol N-acetylglucosamine transferase n=1 Tax=Allopseudospirillum japonicum TaxID=64971 RepID=A0A1H6Q8X8_9GAMM|nr:undecaprenyldiphospho-muramoylpentapeptide beta-N-acetylglucosaminyltransferase [Allopseudospirillum japonicum]SEI40213.1 UDP-N-acetylglucosamine--N-acetylmuramyl-(pentapeptide) pyrophosphoryl-undecaprenol N-acetylglucosamine transferase [Allopseudospirillum japonicum]